MTHKTISWIKSGVRMLGYIMIGLSTNVLIFMASVVLIISEVIGVIEEIDE